MKKLRKKLMWAGIAILAVFALVYSKTDVTLAGNESTRFAVVQAVGEQSVFHIENTAFKTVDRVVRDGHIYSDKPLPIGWTLGMLYKIPHRIFGLNFTENYYLSVYLVNLFFSGLINILLFVWMFRMFCRIPCGNLYLKFFLALGMSSGTWLLSYSVTLNNHTPAALGVLGLYVALDKFRRIPSVLAAAAAGLAAGMVAACDLPSGAVFAVAATAGIFLLAPVAARRKLTGCCIAAGLAVGAGMAALNFVAYGTVVPLYVAGESGTFGLASHESFWKYVFDCLIGTRGLFSYQPFLLLVFPAVFTLWKGSRIADRIMLAASAVLIVLYLAITVEYGGWAYGFRYLIPVIPVLWYWSGRWVLQEPLNRRRLLLAGGLAAVGVAAALVGSYMPFCVSYEAMRSPQGHFTRKIQSTFAGNLLSWSFETNPDSMLTRALFQRYGAENCWRFLHASASNRKDPEFLRRVVEGIRLWSSGQ